MNFRLLVASLTFLSITLDAFERAEGVAAKELYYSVKEEQPPVTFVGNVRADLDSLNKGTMSADKARFLKFKLLSSNKKSRDFDINEETGVVTTVRPIDREAFCQGASECFSSLDVLVSSRGDSFFRVIKIRIDILDLNDHAPYFPQNIFMFIPENSPIRTQYPFQGAVDLDLGINGVQHYEIVNPTDCFSVSVVKAEGSELIQPVLVILRPLDRERKSSYLLRVVAKDRGIPQRSGQVNINVTITDANDHHPSFDRLKYEEYLKEDVPIGTTVLHVKATDRDIGPNAQIIYRYV